MVTEKQIIEKLKQPYDEDLANEVYIYLRNDSRICNSMNRTLVDFINAKKKQKKFNPVLFIQAVYNVVNNFLSSYSFLKEYGEYLPKNIPTNVRYQVSVMIARYVLYDFYHISLDKYLK